MDDPLQFFSDNEAVRAAANLLGIIAGIVILWKFWKVAYNFISVSFTGSVKQALVRLRIRQFRIYIKSARDIHYFLARVISLLNAMLLASVGLIFTSITKMYNSELFIIERFEKQSIFKTIEGYRTFNETMDTVSSVSLMLMFILAVWLSLAFANHVTRLRNRWWKRGRLK